MFEMSVEQALAALEQKIGELEAGLGESVRERYRRLIGVGQRVVVPVLGGICYGCFVAVPTSWAAGADPNEKLNVCQNCGRFLYHPP